MPVLQTTIRRVASVVTVTLEDTSTGQTQSLTATPEHPFYVAGKGFVGAGQLSSGNQVVSRYGPILNVKSVTEHHQPDGYLVYNLVVDTDHTYFVGKVDGGAWVHNVDCPPENLGEIMEGAPLQGRQLRISWPKVQRSVERFQNGETPSPIRVFEDGTIQDGMHRYIASRIAGVEVDAAPAAGSAINPVVPWSQVEISPLDWGD